MAKQSKVKARPGNPGQKPTQKSTPKLPKTKGKGAPSMPRKGGY